MRSPWLHQWTNSPTVSSSFKDTAAFGGLMHEHWLRKRERSQGMSRPEIDDAYKVAIASGALGGKLTGAGGGGFLVVYAADPKTVRKKMAEPGLRRCGSGSTTMGRRFSFVSEETASQCVILAGGVASRLGAHAGDLPKTLVPVAGRPFADHQLTWLAEQGVTQVVYCIGYLGDQIRAYVGDGSRWGLSVAYVDEGSDLRGTGGALRLAYDDGALAEAFAVLYGDSYLRLELQSVLAAFRAAGLPALMTVLRNDGKWDRSNADFDGKLVTRYSKDKGNFSWIDYGLSVLHRDSVTRVPQGLPVDLAHLYSELSSGRLLAGFEVDERFYEIGSPEGLGELERLLAPR